MGQFRLKTGLVLGSTGSRISLIPASPGRPSALSDVAPQAGTDDIIPGRPAPATARHEMIEAQFGRRELLAAVLATIAIPREQILRLNFTF